MDSARWLDLQDGAGAGTPLARALALARALGIRDPAELSLGDRDRVMLLAWTERYGPALACVDPCPSCRERAEFSLAVADLLAVPHAADGEWEGEGWRLALRPVTSRDLAECQDERELVRRCTRKAGHEGVECEVAQVPDAVLDAAGEALADLDPLAEIKAGLRCPTCATEWVAHVDVSELLWARGEAETRDLLVEVATLARNFGWSERDILAMPPRRRRAYLELCVA